MPQTRVVLLALISLALAVVGVVSVAMRPSAAAPVAVTAAVTVTSHFPAAEVAALSPPVVVPPPTVPGRALVAVSVAEVWAHRNPRPFDRPALEVPARIGTWLGRMTYGQRLGLGNRLATQVRYGDQLVVMRRAGQWTRIRIPDQTGGRYPRGITGWVASRQLRPQPVGWQSADRVATVTSNRAVLERVVGGHTRRLTLSYATTLPVSKVLAHRVVVAVPGVAASGSLARSAVSIHRPGTPAIRPSAHQVVVQAKRFLGLPYLWAGMSSWGFDCSGLVSTVFSLLGVTMPRDAADQSLVGHAVSRRGLRPGDLVFFSSDRSRAQIHHVAIYAGHGRVVQSPYTGARVQVTRLWGSSLGREYWGATAPLSRR